MTNVGSLLDPRRRERHGGNVNAGQLNLILDTLRPRVLDALQELHPTHPLFTQKVANFDIFPRQRHINRKMAVHKAHLIQKAARDADHEIFHVTAYGTDTGQLLAGGKPQIDLDDLALGVGVGVVQGRGVHDAHVHGHVFEIARERSEGARDSDNAGFDFDGYCSNNNGGLEEWCVREVGVACVWPMCRGVDNEIPRETISICFVPPSGMTRVREARMVFMICLF